MRADRAMLNSGEEIVNVCQGELSVSGDENVVLTCILGSCIATCLHDPGRGLGGMNHILLPGRPGDSTRHNKFGIFSMEALINELMRKGARRKDLVAKVFGGASTFENGLGIGEKNAAFVRGFLEAEGIPIMAESTGGKQARKVRFYPRSGDAQQSLSAEYVSNVTAPCNKDERRPAIPARGAGQVELF
ncbi:MAG: chemotaxis protein CheD [Pseudomonadota bacterium]